MAALTAARPSVPAMAASVPGVHCPCPCTSGAGCGSPKTQARGRLKSGFFFRASQRLKAPVSTAARAGAPPGAPVPVFRSANPVSGRHPRLAAGAVVEYRNTGAFTMAGLIAGVATPMPSLSFVPVAEHAHVPSASRTRNLHGAFVWGGLVGGVYSSRRQADGPGVTVEALMLDAKPFAWRMSPAQARALAQALHCAAAAADLATKRGER